MLTCVFRAFAVLVRFWLSRVCLLCVLVCLMFPCLLALLLILSSFLSVPSQSVLPFFPSLSAACCSSLTCIRFLRPSFSALSSFRFSLVRSFSCFCLPMLGWSVSVLVVEGRIGQCVCRLVVFAVDVPYFPLHPFVCQLFS